MSASIPPCLGNCINRVIYRIFSVTSSDDVHVSYVRDVFGLPSVRVIVRNKTKKFVDSLISSGQYEGFLMYRFYTLRVKKTRHH